MPILFGDELISLRSEAKPPIGRLWSSFAKPNSSRSAQERQLKRVTTASQTANADPGSGWQEFLNDRKFAPASTWPLPQPRSMQERNCTWKGQGGWEQPSFASNHESHCHPSRVILREDPQRRHKDEQTEAWRTTVSNRQKKLHISLQKQARNWASQVRCAAQVIEANSKQTGFNTSASPRRC
eukprot:gnl/MRDRNA2_/MRDRNA2_17679_c0_seq1.p1 gnl/MRDRNA2_/MRDRNA2_17679_c0~~gnl/MRDRNA2_/MRDRNA2_17679_c0_seq1.p1  ORF type:complete len:183 (+),score=26.44 gnl/MRDRNA2_/MRDRNA2_17679_c0_seq1:89-637(+)